MHLQLVLPAEFTEMPIIIFLYHFRDGSPEVIKKSLRIFQVVDILSTQEWYPLKDIIAPGIYKSFGESCCPVLESAFPAVDKDELKGITCQLSSSLYHLYRETVEMQV